MQSLNTLQTVLPENKNVIKKEGAVSIVDNQTLCEQHIASPEARLILACSRTCINSSTSTQIKELLQEDLDWVYIIKSAQANGVTPLLCHNLLNSYAEFIPERFLSWLKGFSREHTRNNLLQTMELLKIIQLLENNDIPTLPLKGPTLAALVYGDVALRQFCDLDILVHKKNIRKSIKILVDHGYSLFSSPSWFARFPTFASRKKDVALVNDSKSVRIELHWRLSGRHFDLSLGKEALWRSLEKVSLAGNSVRTLPLNDLLLYLTMHGSRHGWMRLAWVCDIAELIRVHQNIDWEVLMTQARTLGCERTLLLGLFLANSLLQTPLPEEVLGKIEVDSVIKPIAAKACESLFDNNHSQYDISYWSKYHLAMKERLRERLRVRLHYYYRYFHIAITPNERDFSILPLPGFLRFLYYLLRPLRFSRDYGVRLFKYNSRRKLDR